MSDKPNDESDVTKDAAATETKITKEAAVAALHENRQARVVAVEQGISALLAEHNCVLDVQMIFSIYNQPVGKVTVLPRD